MDSFETREVLQECRSSSIRNNCNVRVNCNYYTSGFTELTCLTIRSVICIVLEYFYRYGEYSHHHTVID